MVPNGCIRSGANSIYSLVRLVSCGTGTGRLVHRHTALPVHTNYDAYNHLAIREKLKTRQGDICTLERTWRS